MSRRCSLSAGRPQRRSVSPGAKCSRIEGLSHADAREVTVTATPEKGKPIQFTVRLRIDTPKEREYYRHGGILQYVLRQLAASGGAA